MKSATETLSSTAPVRSWYLVRQCFGSVPISTWAEATEATDPGEYPLCYGMSADRRFWWMVNVRNAASVRDNVREFFAPVDESVRTQTALALLDVRNQLEVRINQSLDQLYDLAEEEWFEDGLQSNLSVGLEVLLRNHPAETIYALSDRLKKRSVKQAPLVETLKVLGRIESLETRELRLYIILDFLSHSSFIVRDAALVALCLLNDRRALTYLERAAAREDAPFFKVELEEAIKQLRV